MILAWRHPKPQQAEGLCLGRSERPVDARKAKRLAHRVRATMRHQRRARARLATAGGAARDTRHAALGLPPGKTLPSAAHNAALNERHGKGVGTPSLPQTASCLVPDERPEVWTSPRERTQAVGRWLRRWGWRHRVDARLAELDFGAWDGRPWAEVPQAEIEAWAADLVHHAPGGGETVQALLQRVAAVLAEAPHAALITHGGWLSAALWLRHAPDGATPQAATWPKAPAYTRLLSL